MNGTAVTEAAALGSPFHVVLFWHSFAEHLFYLESFLFGFIVGGIFSWDGRKGEAQKGGRESICIMYTM